MDADQIAEAEKLMSYDQTRQAYIWEHPETGQIFVFDQASDSWILDTTEDIPDLDEDFRLEPTDTMPNLEPTTAEPPKERADDPANPTKVSRKRKKKKKGPNLTIYVQGLPPDATLPEFIKFCSLAGVLTKDPYEQMRPKAKLYLDEKGQCKGDGRATYLKSLSVENAFTLLDGSDFRPPHKHIVKLELAKFEHKEGEPASKKKRALPKNLAHYNQSEQDLGWEEKEQLHVVIKHMFDPRDAVGDINFYDNLKEEITTEFEKCGHVESVKVFERNPEGVVAVKYREGYAAERCIEVMNNRFFDSRKLSAEFYDGFSNYFVAETDEEKAVRDENWSRWLEGNDEFEERQKIQQAVTPPLEETEPEELNTE